MPIGEYLRTHTHMQHLAWLAWLDEQMPVMHRYLQQLCYLAFLPHAKNPKKVKPDGFKVRIGGGGAGEARHSAEESKRRWLGGFAAMGVRVCQADEVN